MYVELLSMIEKLPIELDLPPPSEAHFQSVIDACGTTVNETLLPEAESRQTDSVEGQGG